MISLKFLRHHLAIALAAQYRGKILDESQILWNEIAMMVLGKEKIMEEQDQLLLGN